MIQKVEIGQPIHLYEILDYITVPSQSCIDTGLKADYNTIVEMKANIPSLKSSGAPRLFSTKDSAWNSPGTWGLSIENKNKIVVFPLGYSGNKQTNYNLQPNIDYTFRLEASGMYYLYNKTKTTSYYTYDATSYTTQSTVSDTNIQLFFFRDSHEYLTSGTKIYSCKVWNSTNLIRDYIPVKRMFDNVYGLYDNVNKTFHSNEISGYDFSGVSKQTPEYIDDYGAVPLYVNKILKNSGSSETFHAYELLDEIHCPDVSYSPSYIDIGYSPNVNTEIEVRYKCNGNFVTGNNQRLFYLYGSNWNDSDQWTIWYERSSIWYKFNYNSYGTSNVAWDNSTPHIVKMSHTQLLYDGNQIATNYGNNFTTTTRTWGISSTGTTATGDQSTFNYYYCKIYESGTLVHEFLPVKRLSDNALGFYDNTTSTFHEAVGTFVGTSKSTPEYIDETVSGEITINKIYHNGTIYWGNVTSHVQQNQS